MSEYYKRLVDHTNWCDLDEAAHTVHTWANDAFPGRVPEASLMKLVMEEIPELLQHRKEKGLEKIGEELADCFILLLDLAEIWKVDVPNALRLKMTTNAARTWELDRATGFYNHKKDE